MLATPVLKFNACGLAASHQRHGCTSPCWAPMKKSEVTQAKWSLTLASKRNLSKSSSGAFGESALRSICDDGLRLAEIATDHSGHDIPFV